MNVCEAFINSLDDKDGWSIGVIELREGEELVGNINRKLWDNGAPHTKYFSREYNTFYLTGPVKYEGVIHNASGDRYVYIPEQKGWVELDG